MKHNTKKRLPQEDEDGLNWRASVHLLNLAREKRTAQPSPIQSPRVDPPKSARSGLSRSVKSQTFLKGFVDHFYCLFCS